jgi:hypothetical protein
MKSRCEQLQTLMQQFQVAPINSLRNTNLTSANLVSAILMDKSQRDARLRVLTSGYQCKGYANFVPILIVA